MSVIERFLYVTIGPAGEPHDVFASYETAAHDAATTLRSVQVVVPEYQHRGAVEENERLKELRELDGWSINDLTREVERLRAEVAHLTPNVVVDDAALERAERWMLHEMHEGLSNRACVEAIVAALRGK